jgi:hypothetical protein
MNSNSDDRSQNAHPLAAIPGISPASLAALKQRWIETAEQVIALAATPQGQDGLKTLLACSDQQWGELLAKLKEAVGTESAARLEQPSPGGALGVVLTEEQKKRFGLK